MTLLDFYKFCNLILSNFFNFRNILNVNVNIENLVLLNFSALSNRSNIKKKNTCHQRGKRNKNVNSRKYLKKKNSLIFNYFYFYFTIKLSIFNSRRILVSISADKGEIYRWEKEKPKGRGENIQKVRQTSQQLGSEIRLNSSFSSYFVTRNRLARNV